MPPAATMSTLVTLDAPPLRRADVGGAVPFALSAVGLAVVAAVLAGWLPIQFSIFTVFLFAGPHNWLEFRYFLTRLPGRWGKLRGFFLLAFGGVFALAGLFAAAHWLGPSVGLAEDHRGTFVAFWTSLLILWVLALVQWRSRQNPRRDWVWTVPVAFLLIAGVWLAPPLWGGFVLVYLHPLMALWILDRELRRSRPQWRRAFHLCLLALPVLLGLLWWHLASAPPLDDGSPGLTADITWHAGAGVFPWVSDHCLVATHTFLEMVHYAVWLVAIPLVGIRTAPWRLSTVPLARRSSLWRWALLAVLCVGFGVVLVLWGCFWQDYRTTRDVYFTVALLHVLAEVPFLLRAL
jgi:hypothetical protein